MEHIFIINPAAGKTDCTSRILAMAKDLRARHGLTVSCILTKRPGHAAETCRGLLRQGGDYRFYACGGDGTVNEVASAIAGAENAAMTNIPTGTGNDFLKNFACQDRFADAEALWDGPQTALDTIDCNGRLALTVACCGFDAQIAADVHTYGRLPLLSHRGSYIASLGANFLLRGLGHRWAVTVDEERAEGDYTLAAVCNGRFYGGGFLPMPEARMDDGVLNALLVRKVSRLEFLRFVGPYSKGEYRRFPHAARAYTPKELVIEGLEEDLTLCLDGEILSARRAVLRLGAGKVQVFGPAEAFQQGPPVNL